MAQENNHHPTLKFTAEVSETETAASAVLDVSIHNSSPLRRYNFCRSIPLSLSPVLSFSLLPPFFFSPISRYTVPPRSKKLKTEKLTVRLAD